MRAFLTLLCMTSCVLSLPCAAGRQVRVYEVPVDGQSAPAVQDAMREALVRATGRRESADDPALGSLIGDAPKYVKSYASGARGESQVVFDGAAVEHAITAAGRSVWGYERPFTLVVLDPPRARAASDVARAELERVAAERGLPISLIPVAVVDGAGNPLSADALLAAAQRFGGDDILVGRGPPDAGPDAPLSWNLYSHALSVSWNGPLAAAIDHTVDLLVPQQGSSLAESDSETSVEIEGISTLIGYAATQRLLEGVPGVRRANIAAADANSVTFNVMVRGGAAGLEQNLTPASHLVKVGGSAARVVYRYQPQG